MSTDHLPATLIEAQADLVATTAHNEVLTEALADIELSMEDKGWVKLGMNADREFSREGLSRNADVARVMVVANPLIRRGVQLKIAYVWGSGVSISARAAGEDAGQDVNAVARKLAARRLIHVRSLGDALRWSEHKPELAELLSVDADTLQTRLDHLHPSERHYLRRVLDSKGETP